MSKKFLLSLSYLSLCKFFWTRTENRVIENRVMENRVKRGITVLKSGNFLKRLWKKLPNFIFFYFQIFLLLLPFLLAPNSNIPGLASVCGKLQMEFCRRRRSGTTSMAPHNLHPNDLVLFISFRCTHCLLEWCQAFKWWLLS